MKRFSKNYPSKVKSFKSLIGHTITFGYADTDEVTTGILFKYHGSLQVLDYQGKVQRIDSPEQILTDWGKAEIPKG